LASSSATPKCWGGDEVGDPADDEVVAQVHHEGLVAQELLGDQHGVGQPPRRVLAQVGDRQPEARPVAHRLLDRRVGLADDDADLGDPGVGDGLEAVEEDRLVRQRHELLRAGERDRPQPRPRAT
jgi:hypothetical protein